MRTANGWRERGEAVVEAVEVTKRAGRVAIKNLSFSQQYRHSCREEVRFLTHWFQIFTSVRVALRWSGGAISPGKLLEIVADGGQRDMGT